MDDNYPLQSRFMLILKQQDDTMDRVLAHHITEQHAASILSSSLESVETETDNIQYLDDDGRFYPVTLDMPQTSSLEGPAVADMIANNKVVGAAICDV